MHFHVLPNDAINNDPGTHGALSPKGQLQVMPAAFYEQFTQEEISAFAVRNGFYLLPTLELVNWLQEMLGGADVLEIGAGNGVLAAALGARATDNYMQTWPDIVSHYAMLRQATVQYGPNVENIDAHDAIEKYRPEVVLACWVTHRYQAEEHHRGGNMFGVDEGRVLSGCRTYLHVGNARTHAQKPLLTQAHRNYRPAGLVSRSMSPGDNVVWVWGQPLPGE